MAATATIKNASGDSGRRAFHTVLPRGSLECQRRHGVGGFGKCFRGVLEETLLHRWAHGWEVSIQKVCHMRTNSLFRLSATCPQTESKFSILESGAVTNGW